MPKLERSRRAGPLWFMPEKDRAKLRKRLKSAKGPAWLQFFVKIPIRRNILPAFDPPDPPVHLDGITQVVGNDLSPAILLKLAQRYKHHAGYGPDRLISYHLDETGALIIQAHDYLSDLLMEDLRHRPNEFMVARLQRLSPQLKSLPSFRGKRNTGAAHGLLPLMIYEEEYVALKQALSDVRALQHDSLLQQQRLEVIEKRYGEWATHQELERWSGKSPSAIALEVACRKTHPLVFSFTPKYLKYDLFPKARRFARELNLALARRRKFPL